MSGSEPNRRLERVGFELRASGLKPQQQENRLRCGIHTRGYLPHVKREGARYFVTFRLGDSLPKQVLLRIQAERASALKKVLGHGISENARLPGPQPQLLREIERVYFRRLEQYLDKGQGECWLKQPDIARLVADALRFFEGQRYHLSAWVIMPNHVHVVFWPMPNYAVSEILKSWKGYTGRVANRLLQRAGQTFWQPEAFDHWVRNDEEHARCCSYVVHNPVKAHLCIRPQDWRWSSAWAVPTV